MLKGVWRYDIEHFKIHLNLWLWTLFSIIHFLNLKKQIDKKKTAKNDTNALLTSLKMVISLFIVQNSQFSSQILLGF